MTLEPAYAAVVARPRDDAPRARFADLVAGTEPDTATFVRDQLALAQRRRAAGRADPAVERAARRLLAPPAAHDRRFDAARRLLDGTVPAWAQAFGFGRGFLERATVSGAWFAARGLELTSLAPIVDVTLTAVPADATELFDSPAWSHVRSLRFKGPPVTLAQVEALAASPYLAQLRGLDLASMDLPEAAAHTLARAPTLSHLRYVRADGNRFPDVNPTLDEQDGQAYGERPSVFAAQLRARYGDRPWLAGVVLEREPHPEAWG